VSGNFTHRSRDTLNAAAVLTSCCNKGSGMASRREAVARQIPRLRRYARALTRDDGEADDLIQDTLERALVRLDQWRDGDNPCKWMLSILHNLHVDSLRRQSRRPLHVGLENVGFSGSASAADGASGCDVDRALQHMSIGQRQVLLLVGVEGLTYAETAGVLGIPIGTVMSRLARGRGRLRLLMACEDALKGGQVASRRPRLAASRLPQGAAAWRPPPQRQ
jgi:RNA polymerase sigma-70 factor (ECF subfamily)